MWRCPLCQSDLTLTSTTAHCENQHTFDRAKSGYLNLLPVQFKKTRHPGDDKAMLRARQTFHQLKGYAPLMKAMADIILSNQLTDNTSLTLFDAGCGEGTYLETITRLLNDTGLDVQSSGCDIAKVAVDIASKAHRQHQFVVASSANLPLKEGCLDVLLQVFAPASAKEQERVLNKNGMLVTVDPGPDHLSELKSLVYDTPRQHEAPASERDGFHPAITTRVRYRLDFISDEQKSALLTMTPYMWKVAPEKRATLAAQLDAVTADFIVQLWRVKTTET